MPNHCPTKLRVKRSNFGSEERRVSCAFNVSSLLKLPSAATFKSASSGALCHKK